MNEVLNPNTGKHTYPTPLISIQIKDDLVEEGVRVFLSKFSIPSGTEVQESDETKKKVLRGIANVGFTYPTSIKESTVTLQVYITQAERKREVKIYALKSNGWSNLGGDFREDSHGPWAGYLETSMELGDPPIAVG